MISRGRELVAPLYLLLCIVLGGSAQGVWGNMLLQLVGLAIIGWAALSRVDQPVLPAARQLLLLSFAALVIVILQLVPLPPALWGMSGPRDHLARGFTILNLRQPWMPLSLAPHDTFDAVLKSIPALAMICALVRLKAYRPVWIVVALLIGTFASIMLGALQVSSVDPETSSWYLYADTNYRHAVGFFANANHLATLLLISIPFVAALIPAARGKNIQRASAFTAVAAGIMIVLLVGLFLNGSLAGYALLLPVVAGSGLVVWSAAHRLRAGFVVAIVALFVIGAIALGTGALNNRSLSQEASVSASSRADMLRTTWHASRDFLPFGSGFGTFRGAYQLYEDPAQISSTYVIHAHNDYAELLLEFGVAGIALILLFVGWWVAAVTRVWRSAEAGPFVRAASVASAAVLVHSSVDFPLRTAAVSACFAMCTALLADWRAPQVREASDLRPTRHFTFR